MPIALLLMLLPERKPRLDDLLVAEMRANQQLLVQLLAEQKEASELEQRRLELLEEQVHGKKADHTAAADADGPATTGGSSG
jgi:hypothetical protein